MLCKEPYFANKYFEIAQSLFGQGIFDTEIKKDIGVSLYKLGSYDTNMSTGILSALRMELLNCVQKLNNQLHLAQICHITYLTKNHFSCMLLQINPLALKYDGDLLLSIMNMCEGIQLIEISYKFAEIVCVE